MKARVYTVVPLRSGWICEWVINGSRIDQTVRIRFDRGKELSISILPKHSGAIAITAVCELDDIDPARRVLMSMGPGD